MKRLPPVERFWSKVEKTDSCWIWRGELMASGYGKIKIEGRYWLAHRFSKFLADGELSDELFVCHTCDNPPCVRPEHLFLGTARDNGRDMSAKGRSAGHLTPAQVEQVRNGRIDGASPAELAHRMGVSIDVIYGVLGGKNYNAAGDMVRF